MERRGQWKQYFELCPTGLAFEIGNFTLQLHCKESQKPNNYFWLSLKRTSKNQWKILRNNKYLLRSSTICNNYSQ